MALFSRRAVSHKTGNAKKTRHALVIGANRERGGANRRRTGAGR
jgi:hypothetical protein